MEHQMPVQGTKKSELKELKPLFLVLGFILLTVSALQAYVGRFSLVEFMRLFMGMFFLTFGFFKTLDWKGFAVAFATTSSSGA